MKFRLMLLLCLGVATLTTNEVSAQKSTIVKNAVKGASNLFKWGGKKFAGGVISAAGGYAFTQYFNQDNKRYITVNIVNNYQSVKNIWVTSDGVNWTQYQLKPNYYLTSYSNSSGYVGVYDGYNYSVVNYNGTYKASQF